MVSGVKLLAFLLTSFGLTLTSHILIWRLSARAHRAPYRNLILLFALGLTVSSLAYPWVMTSGFWGWFTVSLIFAALSTFYIFSYVGVEHESPSSHILLSIRRSPGGLTRQDLMRAQVFEDPGAARTRSMFESGWLEKTDAGRDPNDAQGTVGDRILSAPLGACPTLFRSEGLMPENFLWFYGSLLASSAVFLTILTLGLVVFRVPSLVKAYVAAMAGGWIGFTAALAISSPGLSTVEFLSWYAMGGILYACVTYLFFHFLNIPLTSVRLQILGRIYRGEPEPPAPGNPLEIRIERLLACGQLREDESGKLHLGDATPWMLRVFLCFALLRRILGIAKPF